MELTNIILISVIFIVFTVVYIIIKNNIKATSSRKDLMTTPAYMDDEIEHHPRYYGKQLVSSRRNSNTSCDDLYVTASIMSSDIY